MTAPQSTLSPNVLQEEWRPCPGYEESYQVSNLGQVRRDPRALYNWRSNRTLKLVERKHGGAEVCLWRSNKGRWFIVARLVATAFLGEPSDGFHVNHKDGNRRNDCITNLEWLTQQDNVRHAYLHLPHRARKLTADQVRSIRGQLRDGRNRSELAREFGVSWSAVDRIGSGVSWSYLADVATEDE